MTLQVRRKWTFVLILHSDITYHIKNERLYELPKAGGMGTYIFYGIGAFMAMMAIMLFRMKLGRRRGMI